MARVVHWNDRGSGAVLIDRTTPFGNPFRIGRDGDRAAVLAAFRVYFEAKVDMDPRFRLAVSSLSGRELACHCKPMDCHGDVIAEYLERRYGS